MHLITALYKFVDIADPEGLRDILMEKAAEAKITGTLLVAKEGVNGTISGEADALRGFIAYMQARNEIGVFEYKESWSEEPPFRRLKVRLKKEIVSMGAPGVVTPSTVGEYVDAKGWNALLEDPDVAVVDTRNDYEVAIGAFEGAIDPKTKSFREFPEWANAREDLRKAKAVAMYCTGGIRCEKSTAYMRSIGIEKVFHLEGGILKYLETVEPEENRWKGHCFVFDERVSVGADLEPGPHELCHGCRGPITEADKAHPAYVAGVSCPACADDLDPERAARFAERQKQMALAKARGELHLKVDYREDDE